MTYHITASRMMTPAYRWPIVFTGSLSECRAHLANQHDESWTTNDGFRYTHDSDLEERHICRAWYAEGVYQ